MVHPSLRESQFKTDFMTMPNFGPSMKFCHANFGWWGHCYAPNSLIPKLKLTAHPSQKTPWFGTHKLMVDSWHVWHVPWGNLTILPTVYPGQPNLVAYRSSDICLYLSFFIVTMSLQKISIWQQNMLFNWDWGIGLMNFE